jgi:hypothetical protein
MAEAATSASLIDELPEAARADYVAGRALHRDQDYASALIKFRRAFELSRHPLLLWNMAACEKSLRHYVRALRLLEQYEAEAAGRLTEEETQRVRDLRNTLQSLVSTITLVVNQPGARVSVDGEVVGTTPFSKPVLVDLGRRRISATKPGFFDHESVHDIAGAQPVRIQIALKPRPTEAHLTVLARGSDTIRVGDKTALGTRWDGVVRSGTHLVQVNGKGMKPYTTRIDVRVGETRSLNIELVPIKGRIPLGVWIGGGAVATAGLGLAAYLLFRPTAETKDPTLGTIAPGSVQIP